MAFDFEMCSILFSLFFEEVVQNNMSLYWHTGRMEFGMDEDAHVISDCIKVASNGLDGCMCVLNCFLLQLAFKCILLSLARQ